MGNIRQSTLNSEQNLNFDEVYVNDAEYKNIDNYINKKYSANQEVAFVDFGGGNGSFCDLLLETHENAITYNVEISKDLADLNKPNPRKHVLNGSIFEVDFGRQFDVVCLNYVMHHLVSTTLRGSIDLISNALKRAHEALLPGGSLMVFENVLYGLINSRMSSAILYQGTSSKVLATINSALGVNTAGIGVYYFGKEELLELAQDNGFQLEHSFCCRPPIRSIKLWPILAREIRREGFIFTKS